MSKFDSFLQDFKKSVQRLSEVLQQEKNEFIRDSAIQRFEFTFDIAWKTVKAFLEEYHKMRCASPKTCFREAFNQNLIDYDDLWMQMADWRNAAVHTYKEELAEELYAKLPRVLTYFNLLFERLTENK